MIPRFGLTSTVTQSTNWSRACILSRTKAKEKQRVMGALWFSVLYVCYFDSVFPCVWNPSEMLD